MMITGGVGFDQKYTSMKHQEYLIKNPGTKIILGDTELTKYKEAKFNIPQVLRLTTPNGESHESFLDKDRAEVIGNKLLAVISGG